MAKHGSETDPLPPNPIHSNLSLIQWLMKTTARGEETGTEVFGEGGSETGEAGVEEVVGEEIKEEEEERREGGWGS